MKQKKKAVTYSKKKEDPNLFPAVLGISMLITVAVLIAYIAGH
jgi:hypothetical protein